MVSLLPQAVDQAAERFPQREAVRFQHQSLSYAELATRSSQLARVLLEEGVKRGDRVGIYMNKSLESAIAIYGIMKAGAAYVPIDPAAPQSRATYVVRDCGIRYMVGQPTAQKRPSSPYRSISWQEVYQTPVTETPDVGTTEQDLAYILYTSGSTGDPKGIMHTHQSGLSFAKWAKQTYGLHHEDRVSNHAPLHFDLSTFDFFATALAGATTVIIPEVYKKLPASLSKLIADERLTVWYSVPFALTQLLLRGILHTRELSALRWVLFAGEAFPTKYLRQLMQQLPDARFSNLYGPTETNVCTYYHVPPLSDESSQSDEPLPIGKACENAEALVVDENNQPVPPGEVGELLIRGPLVMRGYWGREELSHQDEQGFYHTGDLVQQIGYTSHTAGDFKFIGRKDRQIKTRGYRVELDEIENTLLSHKEVEEAAIFAVPDGQGSQSIEGVVTLKQEERFHEPTAALSSAELRKYMSTSLPFYAVPAKITIVQRLPRTSTGKIDRQKVQKEAIKNKGND